MDKYEELRTQGTNGANFDIETEDVIARLKDWDERYGIDLSEVESDRVTVRFDSLPDDLDSLAGEIYEFCPDTIDQGFGCYDEMIDAAEEMEQEVPDDVRELVNGVDLEDEDYGLELLKRSLRREMVIGLWWD